MIWIIIVASNFFLGNDDSNCIFIIYSFTCILSPSSESILCFSYLSIFEYERWKLKLRFKALYVYT
jgi:hypothetical protein